MAKTLFLRLVSVAMALSGASPAAAAAVSPEANCASVSGVIWNEGDQPIVGHEIDGEQINSLSEFQRMTVDREAGTIVVKGGNFSGWDFREASLSGVCFEDSKLAGANFAGLSAPGVGFIKTDLTGANLAGVNMYGVLFRNAGLQNVNAREANFANGHFDGGWFEGKVEGWNIDAADLTGFTFDCGITLSDGCPVYQGGAAISAKETDFTSATLHSFGLFNVDLTGAKLAQTVIGPGQLPYLEKSEFRGDIILRGGDSDVRLTANEVRILIAEAEREKTAKARPSFDCGKAATKVEQEICGEYAFGLLQADRDVASLYQRAKTIDSGVRASQRTWLKQRNRCGRAEYPADCIRESYSLRKGQLLGQLGEDDWLAPGEAALFIDDVLPFPDDFSRSELMARITPVLVGASMTEILVERASDGLYSVRGSAVGANAHLCSLSASHLYFDELSGWYIPVSEGPTMPIFRIFDGRLEIFAGGRPDHDRYPEASDFMGCGMRASFPETIRIDVSDAVIEGYRKSLNERM